MISKKRKTRQEVILDDPLLAFRGLESVASVQFSTTEPGVVPEPCSNLPLPTWELENFEGLLLLTESPADLGMPCHQRSFQDHLTVDLMDMSRKTAESRIQTGQLIIGQRTTPLVAAIDVFPIRRRHSNSF